MRKKQSVFGLVLAGVTISLGICWSSPVAVKECVPAESSANASAACTQASAPCAVDEGPLARAAFEMGE